MLDQISPSVREKVDLGLLKLVRPSSLRLLVGSMTVLQLLPHIAPEDDRRLGLAFPTDV